MYTISPHFLITMTIKSLNFPVIEEDLDREHKVSLTEGQISIILYILEGYNPLDSNGYDPECTEEINNIFERLEGVIDTFYEANNNPLNVTYPDVDYRELTPFEEEIEIQKYIRENDD